MTTDSDWPSGAVTFLFSDIEDSSPLWERHGAAMRSALAGHDALLRTAVESYGGVLVKSTGDGALAAFSSPSAALAAALAAQRALGETQWPTIAPDRIRVRMGLHTGEAELRDGDFYGTALNRAARIMSLGHGGQVLLSGTTARLVEGYLPGDITLLDLGEHPLKGLARPAHIFQAQTADLPRNFPPLRAAESAKGNLPQPLTAFVGRKRELADIEQLMKEARLLTLTGPGGMGKTRLAIEWANQLAQDGSDGRARYADGLYFVDLAPVENLDQVAPAMAEAFAFPLQGERRSPEQQMLDYLRQKKLLLILDNFEHILGASAFVNEILHIAPGVHVLVTSRERLHLSSEQVYAIEGLTYPPADHGHMPALEELESYSAVQLFLRSARRVRPGFELAAGDRRPVVRICGSTAGMPLALELAAAWIALLPLDTLADEIERRLDLLETEMRDVPARHRSIRAAIDTTYRHLQPLEQQIFALLSIFRGGFTWEAAAAVLGTAGSEAALRRGLAKLQDKSLLVYEARAGRFSVHELLRQYGAEQLEAPQRDPELAATRERHALFYARLLEESELGLKGASYATALRRIESDLENALLAWEWLIENERRTELSAAMDGLGLFHDMQGYFSTGRRNFDALARRWRERLARSPRAAAENEGRDRRFLAKTLAWQSAYELDRQQAESLLLQSLALLDEAGLGEGSARPEKAFALYRLGLTLFETQTARAIAYLNQGLALYQELGDWWGAAYCLLCLGFANLFVNYEGSRHILLQAGEFFEETGDIRGLGQTLFYLIGIAALQDDSQTIEQANSRYQALVENLEQPLLREQTLRTNAIIAQARGQYAEAARYFEIDGGYYDELGRDRLVQKLYLAVAYLHAGHFDQGRALLQETQRKLEQAAVENDHRLAFCLHVMAMLALAEDEFEKAQGYLEKTIPVYQTNNNLPDLAGADAFAGIAFFGRGDMATARSRLAAGLKLALDLKAFLPLGESLLGIALLLADQGQPRRARLLYELVWRRPRFGKSILYDAIAGRKIRDLTAGIPPADLQAIVHQAAEGDIWLEAASLLDDLAASGWDTTIAP